MTITSNPTRSEQLQIGLLFALTVFLSAFLLFSVQLMTAKLLLPKMGGAAAVWNTSVVFFQAVLLLGYAYTHWSSQRLSLKQQVLAQALIMAIPICLLPIQIRGANLIETTHPIASVVAMLTLSVGLPFFAISTLSTRLQQWFGALGKQNPYTLYVASNVGSLLGVLAYPLAIEPLTNLGTQRIGWAVSYIALVAIVMLCGYFVWHNAEEPTKNTELQSSDTAGQILTWRQKVLWIALAAVPSSLLLSVTTHITTDISPIPLFWAVPLAVYLLTFVLVFAKSPLLPDTGLVLGLPVLVALILALLGLNYDGLLPTTLIFGLHLGAFSLLTWTCHGFLAKTRPHPESLTTFYLCLSTGGVLGGVFSAMISPLVFRTDYLEYPILLGCGILLIGVGLQEWAKQLYYSTVIALSIAVFIILLKSESNLSSNNRTLIASDRSFFAVHKVYQEGTVRFLTHGTTLHGIEDLSPARERVPMGYYTMTSPIGQLFDLIKAQTKTVGVMGLGAGGLSAHAQEGQAWTFFEIDPLVEKLARQYFQFLAQSPAPIDVVLGDGRLSLQSSQQVFDLLIMDAFSSDSVPTHLLTQEAIGIYLSKLNVDGAIAFHISNNFLKLEPVLKGGGDRLGLATFAQMDVDIQESDKADYKNPSHWVVLTRPESKVASMLRGSNSKWYEPTSSLPWTDDYSNLLQVILPEGRAAN